MLVRYLGKKIGQNWDQNVYSKDRQPIEMFVSNDDTVAMPLMLGNFLTGKIHNLNRQFPERDFKFTGQLRPEQEGYMPTFEDHLKNLGTTIVGLYPGAGKTVIGAYLSASKKLLTCVLIHLSTQIAQWHNTFSKFTNAKIWIVGQAKNETMPPLESIDVIICMEERLIKVPNEIRKSIGMLIIDEAHCFCTPSRIHCWFLEPKYLILETATLRRLDDAMERIAHASAGYWGLFVPSSKKFEVIPVMTTVKPPVTKNAKGNLDWSQRVKFLLTNETRNNQILQIVQMEQSQKVLILTPQTKHVYHVEENLKGLGYECSTFCENDKSYKDAPILIGTLSKIGTAFDEATFCPTFNGKRLNVVIICITIKKLTLLEQSLGRIMRADSPKTYILLDDDSISKDHWNLMKWWFKGYTQAQVSSNLILPLTPLKPLKKTVKLIIKKN